MKTIEVVVSPTGETKISTKGFQGPACQQASKFLEQALGVVTSDEKTSEYHQSESTQQQVGEA